MKELLSAFFKGMGEIVLVLIKIAPRCSMKTRLEPKGS